MYLDGDVLGGIQAVSRNTLTGVAMNIRKTALGSFWGGALVLTRSTAGGRGEGRRRFLGSDCGGHGE